MAKLAPEALRMREEQGMTVPAISKALHRSERYVRRLLAYARENSFSMFIELPDPKRPEELPDWAQEMLEWSVEAFEKFYLTFSSYPYLPRHLREAVGAFITERRVLVNMPPRHAKSEVFSVWVPLWLICRDRNVQIMIVSQTDQLAKKFTNEISWNLSYNQKLIETFGRFKPETVDWPWRPNSGMLMVQGRTRESKSGDLTVQIRGAKQQILGMEADVVIMDDPTTADMAESETERAWLSSKLRGEVMTRLTPGGRAVCIGQRVHLLDIYGEFDLMKYTRGPEAGKPVWSTHKMPAVSDWGDDEHPPQVLWPELWPFEELMERYESLGYALFECMYQQNPLPLGERMVHPDWITGSDTSPGCLDRDRVPGQGFRMAEGNKFLPITRVLSIDPSPKRYAGVVIADVLYQSDSFFCTVLEMTSQRMSLRDTVQEVERVLNQYAPVDYFVFETSTFSHWLFEDPYFQTLKSRVRVLPHITSAKTKGDPELGIPSMALEFEKGHIRFPYGDAEGRAMTDDFLEQELYTYPQGSRDDRLMALWFIKARWRSLVPTHSLETRMRGVRAGGGVWLKFRRS